MPTLINTIKIEEKKSKFITYFYEVFSKEEVDAILDSLKKEHKNAKHIPFAYKISNIAKKSDDKEPKNTAGMPIYNILEKNNLNNSLVVVVRYFGGTKLGASLLTRTYAKCAIEVIKNN